VSVATHTLKAPGIYFALVFGAGCVGEGAATGGGLC
jgi:hypothetical protein